MVIGISGKALSGKDTIADFLVTGGYADRKVGFGDNLKNACKSIFGLTDYDLFTQLGKKAPFEFPIVSNVDVLNKVVLWMSSTHEVSLSGVNFEHLLGISLFRPRDVLQFVGTDVMRFLCPSYHSDVVFGGIREDENVVISDVRFPNEADMVRELGGKNIRVERPVWLREKYGIVLDTEHPSETSLDYYKWFDCIINNNTDALQTLYSQISDIMSKLEQKWDMTK